MFRLLETMVLKLSKCLSNPSLSTLKCNQNLLKLPEQNYKHCNCIIQKKKEEEPTIKLRNDFFVNFF